MKHFVCEENQIIIHTQNSICASKQGLLQSNIFNRIFELYLEKIKRHASPMLTAFPVDLGTPEGCQELKQLFGYLCEVPVANLPVSFPCADLWQQEKVRQVLMEFVEDLYNFWRTFDRFLVLHSEPGPSSFDQRPYRSFNATTESLTHLIRSVYRDICENITGDHPRVYRQVSAGCDVGLIAIQRTTRLPEIYQKVVGPIPFIRQVWLTPPMIIDPPMNTRTGEFYAVEKNPVAGQMLKTNEWLCYPAQVGTLVIFIYFHQRFMGLGCALSNLFELASDEQINQGPDALYLYGAPSESMKPLGDLPTVFYDDDANHLLVAAVPGEDRFGYFGYLKKMTLTLHNIVMMKRGRMPFHGAMLRIQLKSGREANVLIMGDTATGKSETLEAFRVLGDTVIRDIRIVADDMGSLRLASDGTIMGYGTEIGAFIRLDDLQQGYAFSQIDRAVIMSPQKINARVVLPVTTLRDVVTGYRVDFILYANNFEEVDSAHPVLDRFEHAQQALAVFRGGAAMSKGTTTASGLVYSYFANIFGPSQYKTIHEPLAVSVFEAAFKSGVWVGQIRTRLGIPGFEIKGPHAAANALLDALEISKTV